MSSEEWNKCWSCSIPWHFHTTVIEMATGRRLVECPMLARDYYEKLWAAANKPAETPEPEKN